MGTTVKFDSLKRFLDERYGLLELYKCNGTGSGPGDWKTGWAVVGSPPGCKHTVIWFRTLKQVAQWCGYDQEDSHEGQ